MAWPMEILMEQKMSLGQFLDVYDEVYETHEDVQ